MNENGEKHYLKAGDLFGQGKLKDGCAELEKAVKLGHIAAHTDLGESYAYGLGVEADMEKAVALWRFAADHGDKNACYSLYDTGSGTSLVSKGEAVQILQKAASLGHAKATAVIELIEKNS